MEGNKSRRAEKIILRRLAMLGAIIGDIVGSRFEWNNIKSKEFDFLIINVSLPMIL